MTKHIEALRARMAYGTGQAYLTDDATPPTTPAEPAVLDVGLLAEALPEHFDGDTESHHSCLAYAKSLAAEYRALQTRTEEPR